MANFGDDLKKEREDRGLSLEGLSEATRVKHQHLQALEEGRYGDLPGGVFRRGIAQAYLGAVGLDAGPWMERFGKSYAAHLEASGEKAAPDEAGWATFAENVKRNRAAAVRGPGIRWAGVLVLLAVVLLAAWATWWFLLGGRGAASR